ncbi:winged helix-turn-helix domain-containing protein [Kitasatospora phosalacinea]|uniref:winged helix-turn-helix domain-containing protein n=1 Tax=Kitasatospora phosalacinea TaxID=2065 RepID=UPI002555B247|nr:helix-turn-helix domain-containing protein [Kitasatospora phosalacinea]
MLDVAVIEEPAAAEASLDPMRARLLAALAEPGSAAALAARLGLPRQKVNYHLKELERHGLVELAEERRKGNMTERVYRATAASYVISPAALAAVSPDPSRSPDQLSARWLLALGARLVQEVGSLLTGAARARQRVASFGIDARIRFASAADRAAFAEELSQAVAALVSRYHDESAPQGRDHRLVVGLHQIPTAPPPSPDDPDDPDTPRPPTDSPAPQEN